MGKGVGQSHEGHSAPPCSAPHSAHSLEACPSPAPTSGEVPPAPPLRTAGRRHACAGSMDTALQPLPSPAGSGRRLRPLPPEAAPAARKAAVCPAPTLQRPGPESRPGSGHNPPGCLLTLSSPSRSISCLRAAARDTRLFWPSFNAASSAGHPDCVPEPLSSPASPITHSPHPTVTCPLPIIAGLTAPVLNPQSPTRVTAHSLAS